MSGADRQSKGTDRDGLVVSYAAMNTANANRLATPFTSEGIMSDFTRGTDQAARLCDLRADALKTKLGRGVMLDQVTQGIIDILRDTASQIRNITDRGAS